MIKCVFGICLVGEPCYILELCCGMLLLSWKAARKGTWASLWHLCFAGWVGGGGNAFHLRGVAQVWAYRVG